MSKGTPITRALASFPKLYYYTPPLPKRLVVDGETFLVKSPRDATLWLLETLAADTKKKHCLQGHLLDLVRRWHPGMTAPRFSRMTSDMRTKGLITISEDGDDRRANRLALTKKGRTVLAAIKAHRRKNVVAFLFEGLNPIEQNALADRLEAVAERFWPKIKEAIHRS